MKLFNNRKADEEKVEEEIISMVNEGNEQGLIHDDEVEMITNIFEFSEKEVRDVMTPRSDVVGIDKHTTMDETIKIMLENNYSRYPVFDDDLDNIVGILYFKDFVKAYLQDRTRRSNRSWLSRHLCIRQRIYRNYSNGCRKRKSIWLLWWMSMVRQKAS